MEPPEPTAAAGETRTLAGQKRRIVVRLEGRLDAEQREHRLDGALRTRVAAVGDRGGGQRLVGQPPARREVDTRDLEQLDVRVAELGVAARGGEEPVVEGRAQPGLL